MTNIRCAMLGVVAFVVSVLAPASQAKIAALPASVGQCSVTTVKQIESRLEGMPDSGSAISYVNGGYQVSYDIIPAIQASRPGELGAFMSRVDPAKLSAGRRARTGLSRHQPPQRRNLDRSGFGAQLRRRVGKSPRTLIQPSVFDGAFIPKR